MCFSTYQGCIKDKLNIRTHKTTLGYTWHQTDLEGWDRKLSPPAGHHEAPFFKGGSYRSLLSCYGVTPFTPLYRPGESSGPRRWDSYWTGHPQEPVSPAKTPHSPAFRGPARKLPRSLHPRKLKDTAVDQVFTVFPGPNAVYQPEITFIVLPYNIVNTTFTCFQGNKARRSTEVKLSGKDGKEFDNSVFTNAYL